METKVGPSGDGVTRPASFCVILPAVSCMHEELTGVDTAPMQWDRGWARLEEPLGALYAQCQVSHKAIGEGKSYLLRTLGGGAGPFKDLGTDQQVPLMPAAEWPSAGTSNKCSLRKPGMRDRNGHCSGDSGSCSQWDLCSMHTAP